MDPSTTKEEQEGDTTALLPGAADGGPHGTATADADGDGGPPPQPFVAVAALLSLALLGSFVLYVQLREPPSESAFPPQSRERWPTMVTTVRQCPSDPSTMILSSASLWLTEPVAAVHQFAYTVDGRGRRRDAWQQRDTLAPSILRPGVGYGAPEWDQSFSQTPRAPHSATCPQSAPSFLQRLTALLWPSSAVSTGVISASTDSAPLRVRPFDRHIAEWVRRMKAAHPHELSSENSAPRVLSHSTRPYPFGLSQAALKPASLAVDEELTRPSTGELWSSDDAALLLDQTASYTWEHEWGHVRQQGTGTYFEVAAPWFEAEMPGPNTVRRRLIFYGIEAILPPKSTGPPQEDAHPLLIAVTATIVSNSVPLKDLSWHETFERNYSQSLFTAATCSLHVEVDEETLRRRVAEGEHIDVDRLRGGQLVLASSRLPAKVLSPVWAMHGDSYPQEHSIRMACAVPLSLLSSAELLDQSAHGPVLRLRAVELHIDSAAFQQMSWLSPDTAASLPSSWVLPVCYVRTRRSLTSLMFGQPAYGPPSVLSTDFLHQWIQYHLFLGVQQLYVADRFGSLLAPLRVYMERGLLDYVRWPFLFPIEQQRYQDQPYVIQFLQQFARLASDWVLQLDADEYYTPVHPYFTENERVARAPSDSCHDREAAWAEWERGDGRPASWVFAPDSDHLLLPQVCRSILSEVVSLASMYGVHVFGLASVPMLGMTNDTRTALEREQKERERLQAHWGPLVDSEPALNAGLAEWTAYSRTVLKDRLVWSDLAPSPASCAMNALDLFSVRLHGTDGRIKMLYTARFAVNMWQHDLAYTAAYAAQLGPIHHFVPAFDQGWPNNGANHWRKPMLLEAAVNSSASRALNAVSSLSHLLCAAPQSTESVGSLPDTVRSPIQQCCAVSADQQESCIAEAINRSGGQWEVAKLTPHFPLLSEVFTSRYATEDWYRDLPLSVLNHISHVFCISHARHTLASCGIDRMFGVNIKTLSESRDLQPAEQSQSVESSEDASLSLIRSAFRKWRFAQTWALQSDQHLYWRSTG